MELEQMDIVKEYREVLHNVVNYQNVEPKQEYYKSSKIYDYYIEYPYEKFEYNNNGYSFRKRGYNAIGKGIGKYKGWSMSFCVSLCNYSLVEIVELIEKHVKEDEEEYNALFGKKG